MRGIGGRERTAGHVASGSETNPSHTKRNRQPSPLPHHWLHSLISAFLHSYVQDQAWLGANAGLGEVIGHSENATSVPFPLLLGWCSSANDISLKGRTVVQQLTDEFNRI